MKLRILIYLVVSLFLSLIYNRIKIDALSTSSDGMFLVYEEDEKIYLKNYNNDSHKFVSNGKMPTLSSDGRFIVFSSSSFSNRMCPSLLENKLETCVDIIIYDRFNETFINKTSSFNNHSYSATLSSNNQFLVVETLASNIEGLNSYCDSYYNENKRSCSNIVSINLSNNKIKIITNNTYYDSFDPRVNEDGSIIVFRSFHPFSKEIKKSCYNDFYSSSFYCSTIYYYNSEDIIKVSSGKADAYNGLISNDGNYITYQSYDMEIDNYQHYYNSIYKYELSNQIKTLITNNPNRMVENTFINEDGTLIGILTEANNLTEDDSFNLKYLIYNETTKSFKVQEDVCEAAISTLDGKISFTLLKGEIKKAVYNDIVVKNEYETYFLINSTYDLTKNIVIPPNYQFRIIDVGNFSINKEGEYLITIEVFNNDSSITYSYPAYVISEDKAPVFNCLDSYLIEVGNSSFSLASKIEVFDIIDGQLNYQVIDDGNLNIYQEGTYEIVLKATDSSNNTTYKTISIKVYEEKKNNLVGFLGAIFLFGGLFFYIYHSSKKNNCS